MLRWLKGLTAAILAVGASDAAPATPREPANDASKQVVKRTRLAFVLLREASMPTAETVIARFERIAPKARTPALKLAPGDSGASADAVVFDLGEEGRLILGLLPTPVPRNEAEWHAEKSLAAVRAGWKLAPHHAHLLVMWQETATLSLADSVNRYTWLLAAVADAAKALGVYWADSGATHPAEYFVEVAGTAKTPLLVTLWSGLSVASDRGDPRRMSLVSLGMTQLGLPDLELTVPRSLDKSEAVGLLYDLLSYAITRGAAIAEGETVGRSAEERLEVRYVRSPVDPEKKVWRVDLPGE